MTIGDDIVSLLGLPVDDPRVQAALARFANGVQPALDPDREVYIDWVTAREIGIEFGFEDEANVRALSEEADVVGPLILTQLYFYGTTKVTEPWPYPLPFGLDLADDRASVRRKLAPLARDFRSYVRDTWRFPLFILTAAYEPGNGRVQSLFLHIPKSPWRPLPDLPPPGVTVSAFIDAFGMRWSSRTLRTAFASLGYDRHLPEVRDERCADMRMTYGVELYFGEAGKMGGTDPALSKVLTFAHVAYFAAREQESREWTGQLPFGLRFHDSQAAIFDKIRVPPIEHRDGKYTGFALWDFGQFILSVLYSNLDNKLERVNLMAPPYWRRIVDVASE